MKKIRSVLPLVLVSIPLSLGAIAAACGSYVASEGNTGGTGGGGATGGTSGGDAGGGNSTSVPATPPCDLFEAAGHPCVSAHSTVRVLRSAYSGPLYQLCKGAARAGPSSCQGETLDIGVVEGGYADAAAHAAFCGSAQCTITKLYDQAAHESGPQNDLEPAPPGGNKPSPGDPVNAMNLPVTINGHEAYGMLFRPGMGYRTGCNDCNVKTGNGTAVGDEPESMYMVTSQHDTINGCCFDYGNAETTCNDDGNGTMEAVYLGMGVVWGTGSGEGPWVMADLENGLYAGWENGQDQNISTNTPLKHDFVTAVVVGYTRDENAGAGRFALYGGDATSGTLKTMYDGIRPEKPGYVPMKKQGSIILGIGGDNSDGDGGRFYEGVMVTGAASKQTVDALQAAIVAAGYGR
jgi:hypothetical protein